MALVPGTRLGSYDILSLIGSGGMGEVYRARDSKLGRAVAIKVLPDSLAYEPDRVARFEREAKALAALNHPRIAALFGLEQSDGRHLLVMELVEGETLADRIARGPVPPENALKLALQIADALEAAHEKGIVHRDLKPANLKITPDDQVKVLDFGLAKATEVGAAQAARHNATHSPTLSLLATEAGIILGTASYMSPEQAKGLPADQRSDVFSFGVVLYEMLAGRRPFQGDTAPEILASVIIREANLEALPPNLNPRLLELLKRCLHKNPRQRWQAIGDVRAELETIAGDPHGAAAATQLIVPPRSLWKRAMPIVATAVGVGALAAGTAWTLKPSAKPVVTRFTIPLPEGQQFSNPGRQLIAISADGTKVVYVANLRLYVRTMWDNNPTPIPGTDSFGNVLNPVFSPDGQSIVFQANADQTLKRIPVTGGTAITLCPASLVFGMSWSGEHVLFGQPAGIMRVSASGGKPELLVSVKNGEVAHGPQVLPGGDLVLFTLLPANISPTIDRWDKGEIVVQSLKTGDRKTLIKGGTDGRYLTTGHLVYAFGGVVFAVSFDPARLTVARVPVPLVEGVRRAAGGGTGTAQFSVSSQGSLVYLPGPTAASPDQYEVALLDLKGGTAAPLKLRPGPYQQPRISPDGKSVAFHSDNGKDAMIWVYDLSGVTSMRRLTIEGRNRFPVWSADGQRVAFQSDREGDLGMFWQRTDGTGTAERLTTSGQGMAHVPEAWSPDGKFLLFSVSKRSTWELWMYSLSERKGLPLEGINSLNPLTATFSPDGRWFAYASTDDARSDRRTVTYVQPFPATGTKYEIAEARHPMWSADGKQLFAMRRSNVLVSFSINTQPSFAFGNASRVTPLIDSVPSLPRGYDMGSDGKVIGLMIPGTTDSAGAATTGQIQVVLNWFEELRQRVPLE